MEENDLLVKLNKNYKSFSKGQRLLASYIMENYDRAAFITASKMGRAVGVSESTVVRFAYALGYDGYPEMQKFLQDLIRNKLTSVQRIQLTSDMDQNDILRSVLKADIANIRSTIDSVDNSAFNAAVAAMFEAKRVYIIGIKSAAPLAQFLTYYLNFIMENVICVNASVNDALESMIRVDEGDVCIGISFPRYSTRTVEALTFGKSRGARVIAITDSVFSPIAELADYVLVAHSDMASFADSLTAPLSLINAIIVAASLKSKDKLYERFVQLEGIWDSQRVYTTKGSEKNQK
ncbi:MAG TPA: MurR/RpiR family transcriptional regulator [Clostridia bacterium]|jgi:DNA-binding MurR/RpiR family transcriptional regulator|nr:MurR/RpiR family transcriptional regulator [Clostridia bacterium]